MVAHTFGSSTGWQMDLCEFEAHLVCMEFQASQDCIVRPYVSAVTRNYLDTILFKTELSWEGGRGEGRGGGTTQERPGNKQPSVTRFRKGADPGFPFRSGFIGREILEMGQGMLET